MPYRIKRTQRFILLEVVIALLLIALFAPLFFTSPFQTLTSGYRSLGELKMQSIADSSFLEITETLPSMHWDEIMLPESKAAVHSLPAIETDFGLCTRSYKLFMKAKPLMKEDNETAIGKLHIALTLSLQGKHYKPKYYVITSSKKNRSIHPY